MSNLADRAEIHELIMRYPRALDGRDWALLRTCFVHEGVLRAEHQDGRHIFLFDGAEKVVSRVSRLDRYKVTMHFMGNELVELDGDTATTEVYAIATHIWDGTAGAGEWVIGIRYQDTVVRTGDGWKFKDRLLIYDWEKGEPRYLEDERRRV